jgi:hypothetical protein
VPWKKEEIAVVVGCSDVVLHSQHARVSSDWMWWSFGSLTFFRTTKTGWQVVFLTTIQLWLSLLTFQHQIITFEA